MLDFDRINQKLQAPVAAPLHARLRGAIQAQLMDGTLQPGETLPPERTLHSKLGISRSTVRQAIKSLIDDGLLKSVVGAGTFVLEPPKSPPNDSLVGFIIPSSNFSVYYPELVSSFSFSLREAGYRVDMSIHNERYETLPKATASLLSQQAAAIVIVAPSQPEVNDVIRQLRASNVTIMLLTRYLDTFDDFDYVGADNRGIGYEATQHLIELGHTNILHIAGNMDYSTGLDRATGYVEAMQKAGLAPQIFIGLEERPPLSPELMPYIIKAESTQLWARVARKEFTAIFCFNDRLASWVQKEIRNLNLAIPDDLSLIGIDNMPYDDFFDVPLTTFVLPGAEIGQQGAALLLRRLKGETFPPQRILLPARFIHRLSTAAAPQISQPK